MCLMNYGRGSGRRVKAICGTAVSVIITCLWERAVQALKSLKPAEARWSDVSNTIRMVVQELRREYGDDGASSPNGAPPDMPGETVPFAAVVAALQKAKGTRTIGSDDDDDGKGR